LPAQEVTRSDADYGRHDRACIGVWSEVSNSQAHHAGSESDEVADSGNEITDDQRPTAEPFKPAPSIFKTACSKSTLRQIGTRASAQCITQADSRNAAKNRSQKRRRDRERLRQNQISGNDKQQLIGHRESDNSADEQEKDGRITILTDPKGHGLLNHLEEASFLQIFWNAHWAWVCKQRWNQFNPLCVDFLRRSSGVYSPGGACG
jgi:hypothetical protein